MFLFLFLFQGPKGNLRQFIDSTGRRNNLRLVGCGSAAVSRTVQGTPFALSISLSVYPGFMICGLFPPFVVVIQKFMD